MTSAAAVNKRCTMRSLYFGRMSQVQRKRVSVTALIAVVLLSDAPALAQPETSALRGSISLSSDYVLNGLAQTHDDPSVRLSLDFEHRSGFFAGGSVGNVDYLAEAQFRKPRDTQAVLYAGYLWRRGPWMTNLTLSRYRYPGLERSYDYTQATANVSFRDRYFLAVSRSSSYLAVYDGGKLYRAGIALPWFRNLEFGVNAGRFEVEGPFYASYSFWDIGLSRPFGKFALDLRYHDNTYGYSTLLGNRSEDLWVLSMTYSFLSRDGSNR